MCLIYRFPAVTSRIRQIPDEMLEVYLQSRRQDTHMRDRVKPAETNGMLTLKADASGISATISPEYCHPHSLQA